MKSMPSIKIVDVADNPDGSSLITFETNEAFDQMYLKNTGRKNLTDKGLGSYVIEIITKAIEGKDEFSIKNLNKDDIDGSPN